MPAAIILLMIGPMRQDAPRDMAALPAPCSTAQSEAARPLACVLEKSAEYCVLCKELSKQIFENIIKNGIFWESSHGVA